MGRNADIGVEAEAGNRRTAPSGRNGDILQIDRITDRRDTLSCAWSGGYSPRDGSAIELGKQRLVLLPRIGLLGIDPRALATAL